MPLFFRRTLGSSPTACRVAAGARPVSRPRSTLAACRVAAGARPVSRPRSTLVGTADSSVVGAADSSLPSASTAGDSAWATTAAAATPADTGRATPTWAASVAIPNCRGSGPATGVAPQPTPAAPGAAGKSPRAVFEFGSTSAAPGDVRTVAPRLPSPTPAVVEIEGDALANVSAPTGASIFTMGSGVKTLTSAPAARPPSPPRVEVDEPRLPSPTPASPPPSPRASARRRLLALGLPLASPSADSPTSSRGRRAGTWSPAALGLAQGASNDVARGHASLGIPDEDEGGRSAARRW